MSRLASVALLASAPILGGCFQTGPVGSTVGGECRIVSAPRYEVLGKTSFDQRWISDTTEAIVVGCRQPRPGRRPPGLDPAPVKTVAVAPVTAAKIARQVQAMPPKKREGFIRRLRARYGI